MSRPSLVLVVDDDADTRDLYTFLLQAEGCVVEQASDGREALASVMACPPAVVVTDLGLPGLDGRELIERMRQDERTRDVAAILLTGSERVDVTRAVAAESTAPSRSRACPMF